MGILNLESRGPRFNSHCNPLRNHDALVLRQDHLDELLSLGLVARSCNSSDGGLESEDFSLGKKPDSKKKEVAPSVVLFLVNIPKYVLYLGPC